jgi:hypothetical protein
MLTIVISERYGCSGDDDEEWFTLKRNIGDR